MPGGFLDNLESGLYPHHFLFQVFHIRSHRQRFLQVFTMTGCRFLFIRIYLQINHMLNYRNIIYNYLNPSMIRLADNPVRNIAVMF